MKYYISAVFALFGAVNCFADSGGSLTHSFDKDRAQNRHPT